MSSLMHSAGGAVHWAISGVAPSPPIREISIIPVSPENPAHTLEHRKHLLQRKLLGHTEKEIDMRKLGSSQKSFHNHTRDHQNPSVTTNPRKPAS